MSPLSTAGFDTRQLLVIIWSLSLFLVGLRADAAELRGQVTDKVSKLPIEGAMVTLDATPPDGTPEFTVESDAFGFYTLTNVPAGSFRVEGKHPAYLPDMADLVVALESARLSHNLALTPIVDADGARFDVLAEVADVMSGLPLARVPVRADRYAQADDPTPTDSFVLVTVADGRVAFRGMKRGYYNFRLNSSLDGSTRPKWEPLANTNRTLLMGDHLARAMLKPIPQDFTVKIIGFDPAAGTNGLADQPLKRVFVEMEGVNPADTNEVLIPVRVGVTDTNGLALFTGLPAIAWKISAKRLGYAPATITVFPDASDALPMSPFEVTLPIQPAALIANLVSPYLHPTMMTGLVARLEGFTNSLTEGIQRTGQTSEMPIPGEPMGIPMAMFEALLPGTYRLSITGEVQSPMIRAGKFVTTNRFTARFSASRTFDVRPGPPSIYEFPLEVERARVRVRYYAADDRSDFELPDPLTGVPRRPPAFSRRPVDGALFLESALASQLKGAEKVYFFGTDDSGENQLSVLPSVYGIQIPTVPDYFGSHIRLKNVTTGETLEHGWPFDVNPDLVTFPTTSPHHALGLVLNSAHEYELELYTRFKEYDVRGEIKPDPADPVKQQVTGHPLGGDPVVTAITDITGSSTASFTGPGGPSSVGLKPVSREYVEGAQQPPNAFFVFTSRGPGSYMAIVDSLANTITSAAGGGSLPFSLPDWGPPGILDPGDAADAAAGVFPLETKVLTGTGGGPAFTATYLPALDTLRLEHYIWNTNLNDGNGDYELAAVRDRPDFFAPDYTIVRCRYVDDAPFKMQSRFYDLDFVLGSNVWYRASIFAPNVGMQHVVTAYQNGPSHNLATAVIEDYAFEVRAVSAADPSLIISNVTVTLNSGPSVKTPFKTNSWLGGYRPTSASHSTWAYTNAYDLTLDGLGGLVLTLKLTRGMGVDGLVNSASNSAPIPEARVQVLDRFGNLLGTATTGADGRFTNAPAIPHGQVVFVDVTAPGFVQQRVRHAPISDPPDLTVTNSLVPIPLPLVLEKEFDRFGMFLPGVRRSGNQSEYEDSQARMPLTMNWRLRAKEHTFALPLREFDAPSGDPRGSFISSVTDTILEVWLVDARSFPGDPYNVEPILLMPPATNDPPAIRAWLRDIRNGTLTNVYHQRVPFTFPAPGGAVEARGPVALWELPPGEFKPYFIIVTQRGTVALVPMIYSGPDANKTLRGQRLPPWMAFVADMIGFVAGVQSLGVTLTEEAAERLLPSGRFTALPEFTVNITTNQGYLDYDYGLDINWKEGVDTPRSGLLAFAPSVAGLKFGAELDFGLEGISNRFRLGVNASVGDDEQPLPSMLPASLEKIGKVEGGFGIVAGTTAAASYDPFGDPTLFEVLNHVGGNMNAKLKVNAKPVTSKIPYVGPVLLALDKAEVLQIFGTVNGGIGMVVSNRWRTVFPTSRFQGTGASELDHVLNRHFMGGSEVLEGPPPATTGENSLSLCLRFGVGIEAEAFKGAASAVGEIALQGFQCGGLEAVVIEPNTIGDWPPIKRISGAVNASLELSLKVWIAEFSRKYEADLLTFDHSFGTEAAFQLVPVTAIGEILLPSSITEEATLAATGPDRVKGFYSAGATATAAGALVFTDVNPATSNMVLRLALGDGRQLETPITLAEAGGIVSVAAARLPTGAWMVVWSEIADDDVGNAYPPSTLKYSLSDSNAANWSTPATIASLTDVAMDLRLVVSDTLTGLVFLHTAEGPLASRRSIAGSVWNGTSWSPPTDLLPDAEVRGFDARGRDGAGAPPALIAWSDGAGTLRSLTWNGASTTGPHSAGTNATDAICLTLASNKFVLAWASDDAQIHLSRFDDVSTWTLLGTPITDVFAAELCVAPLTSSAATLLALTWVDASDSTELGYMITDANGNEVRAPTFVAFPDAGRYSILQLAPTGNRSARLIARHKEGGTTVREFVLTAAGVAPWLLNPTPAGGGLQFELIASPDQSYRLQGSSNLVHWTDLVTVTPTNSPVLLQNVPVGQHQFYRTVSP